MALSVHHPVLLAEVVRELAVGQGAHVFDATIGGGGHAEALLQQMQGAGEYYANDVDAQALERATQRLQSWQAMVIPQHGWYDETLERLVAEGKTFDAILADLGWSSDQIQSGRGLSFNDDTLDMRLSPESGGQTAADIIATYSTEELSQLFREYGEEPNAFRIAKAIVAQRTLQPITSAAALSALIGTVVPRRGRLHPATLVFQALRIVVNDELGHLQRFLAVALRALKPGGRLAIITFHSLEDRIVKHAFREAARTCVCPPEAMRCTCSRTPTMRLLTKKPIVASESEVLALPPSRSAKLRVIQKI